MRKLEKFFNPKSIAVIGASRDRKKLGSQILKNIIFSGFKGKIYPINPKAKKIQSLISFYSVLDVPNKIDLAVIIVPKETVPRVLEEIGKKRIKSVIIITAGFGETGKEGKKAEEELGEIAKKYDIRIVGPNCLGIIDTYNYLNITFAGVFPLKKNLAVVSQSGAMCAAILDWASENNIGFSRFISLGNKMDINEIDMFKVLGSDKNSKVVLGYIEGIDKGREFIKEASKLTRKKPLIAIKSGLSKAGAKAALSHTGSLTNNAEVIKAAFLKAGIIRVDNIEELFDFSEAFSALSFPKNNKVAILANAGGPAVLTTDEVARSNLELAKFSNKTKKLLKSKLPLEASILNPVDIVGDADASRFKKALDIILSDKNVSSLIVILTPQTSTEIEKTAEVIFWAKKRFKKPIISSFIGGNEVESGVKILEKHGVPNFEFPKRAVKALSKLVSYKEFRRFSLIRTQNISRNKAIERIIRNVKKAGRKNLDDVETKKVVKALGIKMANSFFVKTAKEAATAAEKIGYPVVLKIVSSDVLHKTEHGLVKTSISNKKQVKDVFFAIRDKAREMKVKFSGVMVYEMIKEGTELIIGAKKDPVFGPVVMFGLGGIYVRLFEDTKFCISPVSNNEAYDMIKGIKGYRLLTGFRGQRPANIKKIKNTILKVSSLVTAFPEISELDINPLKVYSRSVTALDIKIVLE